ncbi:hypothetical protein PYCCODRAFT_909638 [Trametes coccinea BRFM310]|uniref:Uncharacterized protein n=1 Tax=Trametes coccinea (strain BRFM310) TaxID=1353009 RepID=A0A1Y2ICL8_TRAC3|nr:hypothetical protein PYCCODRAFT_909638 [Trametes coccinea BRFM310]
MNLSSMHRLSSRSDAVSHCYQICFAFLYFAFPIPLLFAHALFAPVCRCSPIVSSTAAVEDILPSPSISELSAFCEM